MNNSIPKWHELTESQKDMLMSILGISDVEAFMLVEFVKTFSKNAKQRATPESGNDIFHGLDLYGGKIAGERL